MKKIAILASGNGSNVAGLVSLFNEGNRIRVSLLLTDRENAPVVEFMRSEGVETIYIPRETWSESPEIILDILRERNIDMIVADGFGSLIPSALIKAYSPLFISIFPSLTPSDSAGIRDIVEVQKNVMAEGSELAGTVVCRVEDSDATGTVIFKSECAAGDDPVLLAQHVSELGRSLLPRAVVAVIRESENKSSSIVSESLCPNPIYKTSEEVKDDAGKSDESGSVPPPVPSVDEKWAEALKVEYDPSRVQPPVIPGATVEQVHSQVRSEAVAMERREGQAPSMPPSYIVWSVLTTVLCCFVPGIIAIIYSSQVSSKFYAGDHEGARRSSRNAEIWIIVSFVLGVLSSTLYLPFMILSGGLFD